MTDDDVMKGAPVEAKSSKTPLSLSISLPTNVNDLATNYTDDILDSVTKSFQPKKGSCKRRISKCNSTVSPILETAEPETDDNGPSSPTKKNVSLEIPYDNQKTIDSMGSLKKSCINDAYDGNSSDDDYCYPGQEEDEEFERSGCDKFTNYLFCRADLARAKLKEKPVSICELFKYGTKADITLVLIGCVLSAICGVCQPLFAVINGKLANVLLLLEPTDPEFVDECVQCIIFFCVVGLGLSIIAFLQFFTFNVACSRIIRNIRCAFLQSILKQDQTWFEKNHCGALNTKLNDNVDRLSGGIGDKFGLLMRNGCQFICGLIVAFYTNWKLALPLCVLSPLIAIIMGVSSRFISSASRKEMSIYSIAGSIAEEALNSIRTVASLNGQETEVKRYEKELNNGRKAGIKKGLINGMLEGSLHILVMTFIGLGLAYGAILYKYEVVEKPGEIFTVVLAIMSGAFHLGLASPHLMVLLTARVAAATVYKTIDRIPKIDGTSGKGKTMYPVIGNVCFKNVSFRYPSNPEQTIIRDLSFEIKPNETIALVGHSGSGKSTCASILTRLYPSNPEQTIIRDLSFEIKPNETIALVGHSGSGKSTCASILTRLYEYGKGEVTIDGINIRELSVKYLRTITGIVQQEPIIFNDTVRNNILIGNPNITHLQIVEACKLANAHEFIELLEKGYDTRIGEGGIKLSGGQNQRLNIARVLARSPKILILDEATSAFEKCVQEALLKASVGRATLVIAHRLSTVRNADKIIVLEKGNVIEAGNHNELLELNGVYKKFVDSQTIEQAVSGRKKSVRVASEGDNLEFQRDSEDEDDLDSVFGSSDDEHFERDIRKKIRASFCREFKTNNIDTTAEIEALQMEVEEIGSKETSFFDIFRFASDQYLNFGIGLAITLISACSMPLTGLLYGLSFANFGKEGIDHVDDALIFLIYFAVFAVISGFMIVLNNYLFSKVGENVTMKMRVSAFKNMLNQDGAYFDDPKHTPGKLITRLATDAPNVKAAMDLRLAKVLQGVCSMISAIIMAMFFNYKLTLCGAFLFICQGCFQFFLAKKVHQHSLRMVEQDEAGRLAIEAIEHVKTIQLLTAEEGIFEAYNIESQSQLKKELKKSPLVALQFASGHGLQQLTQALSYTIGLLMLTNGMSDKASVFQVVQLLYFGSMGILYASEFFPEFVKSRLSASLMFNLINRVPATGDPNKGEDIKLDGKISLRELFFAYPSRKEYCVMKSFNLKIEPGTSVALVGPSGCGKSTIISLLERFYDPSAGSIHIDNRDIKEYSLTSLRRQIGLVGQMPQLFSGTIKENILYGLDASKFSQSDIEKAAKTANAHEFISNLPLGYDTDIGEKGGKLSGGQKQRIAIARTLAREPKVLLLDESTSALDAVSEKAVQKALDGAIHGRTTITIAHKLSTIINSDLIVYIESGKIKEFGTHQQLLALKGKYADLVSKQDLSAN
uniref:ABC transmembrane type-1 domain-containing protein n=1 Tax=Rhabditophanes sp. KR3021 TaxID=114890 RepID=A0AC35TLG3_9BILA